jgi:hypothetical protein
MSESRPNGRLLPIQYFSPVARRRAGKVRRVTLAIVFAGALSALSGCGGGGKQDEGDPTGTFKVDVPRASFPGNQHLAQESTLEITVVNKDSRKIPKLAVTVDGFSQRRDDASLADPNRPIWIINEPPIDADTALTNTWALGPVDPGQSRTFKWKVTPVRAGTYSVRYRVAAGLYGKAKVQDTTTGGIPKGSFIARVSRKPRPVPPVIEQQKGAA